MESKELLTHLVENAGFQVEKCFEGMPAALHEAKLTPHAMSPRLVLAHFLEVFEAAAKEERGESHEWGSYANNTESFDTLWQKYTSQRKEYVAKRVDSDSPSSLKQLGGMLVLHETYHVGQLCLLRVEQDPTFNPYSIYQF